ncbi:MAG: chemotaxis protein [Desulfovibrio sp.]|nr:chemotaxis protein [Desulfovibrio sp.]
MQDRVTSLLALCLLLSACGPKDIGQSLEEEEPIRTSVSSAEQMRYPIYGTDGNQKMLYLNNTMDTMVLRQTLLHNALKPSAGGPSPEHPSYRAFPKQASPFRQ